MISALFLTLLIALANCPGKDFVSYICSVDRSTYNFADWRVPSDDGKIISFEGLFLSPLCNRLTSAF